MGEPLYNPNDRLTGRDGGPYLDQVQAQQDEILRAKREGRKPDLDNPSANAGIPLSTAAQLIKAVDVNQPSAFHETHDEARRMFKAAADDDKSLMKQADEIPDLPEDFGNDVEKNVVVEEDVVEEKPVVKSSSSSSSSSRK